MAIKSKLLDIDLRGDLNISQNKYDVMNAGESGYLNNNGNLYGGVLSPVYRTDLKTKAIYYDEEFHYTINAGSLYKTNNGSTSGKDIMSFSESFDKTQLDYNGVDSIYLNASGEYEYIKLESDHIIVNDNKYEFSEFSDDMVQPLKTRILNNLILILFIDRDNKYQLGFYNKDLSLIDIKDTGFTDIRSPLITTYGLGAKTIISCYSDSGSSVKYLNTRTFIYDGNSVVDGIFQSNALGLTKTVTTTSEYSNTINGGFNQSYSTGHDDPVSTRYKNNWRSYTQELSLSIPETNGNNNLKTSVTWYLYIKDATNPIASINTTPNTLANVVDISYPTSGLTYEKPNSYDVSIINKSASNDPLEITNGGTNVQTLASDTLYKIAEIGVGESATYKVRFNSLTGNKLKHDGTAGQNVSQYTNLFAQQDPYFQTSYGVLLLKVSIDGQEDIWYRWIPAAGDSLDDIYDIVYNTKIEINKDYTLTSETIINEAPDSDPTGILENGTLICTQTPTVEDGHIKEGLYAFTGLLTDIEGNIIHYDVTDNAVIYLGMGEIESADYPYYLVNQSVTLYPYYFRNSLFWKGYKEREDQPTRQLLYDSGFNKVFLDPGYDEAIWQNKNGSEGKIYNWRLLYNNNILSNISYGEDSGLVGTILEDWNITTDVLYVDNENIIYTDTDKVFRIRIVNFNKEYTVVGKRFIVINTTSYLNTWDMEKNEAIHWASDWNNRYLNGWIIENYLTPSLECDEIMNNTLFDSAAEISAQNANYEITKDVVTSYIMPYNIYTKLYYDEYYLLDANDQKGIDFYFTSAETTPTYYSTYKNGIWYGNPLLLDAFYVSDVSYNPNIFTRFIETYNLNDMVINEGYNTAYPLNKYNGAIIYNYQLLNGLENAEDVFVVQTLYYMVSKGKIFEIIYDNGNIKNFSVTANIENMIYIGCLPTEAIFWDYVDRSFWSFSGDAILRKIFQSNEISEIKNTWYNPATQEIFVATDIGLLNINNTQNYLEREWDDVSHMWFFGKYFILQNGRDVMVAYEPSHISEPSQSDMHVETKWFGAPENKKIQIDCIYFRLLVPESYSFGNRYFNISSYTMTDYSVESDVRELNEMEMDPLTNSVYIRYQPKYQKCVSMKLDIHTNIPIISWSIGFTPLDEIGAISTVNI